MKIQTSIFSYKIKLTVTPHAHLQGQHHIQGCAKSREAGALLTQTSALGLTRVSPVIIILPAQKPAVSARLLSHLNFFFLWCCQEEHNISSTLQNYGGHMEEMHRFLSLGLCGSVGTCMEHLPGNWASELMIVASDDRSVGGFGRLSDPGTGGCVTWHEDYPSQLIILAFGILLFDCGDETTGRRINGNLGLLDVLNHLQSQIAC